MLDIIEEIEAWKQDVRSLLAIPEAERTEREQIRVWARRVRLLGNGWRVILSENGEPVFRYIGNADGWPEYWDEILKERFEDVENKNCGSAATVVLPGRDSGMAIAVLADQSGIQEEP